MSKTHRKMLDEIKKEERKLEKLAKLKTEKLVKYRKAEFWIKDQQEEYQAVVRDYNRIKHDMKKCFRYRKCGLGIKFRAFFQVLFDRPLTVFVIPFMNFHHKFMIEEYWNCKMYKMEMEETFDLTENLIMNDKKFVQDTEKHISKMRDLIKRWKKGFEYAELFVE